LSYAPWDVGSGFLISETKRVTVDAGSHFDRFESSFKLARAPKGLELAIGIAKHKGGSFAGDLAHGIIQSWEPFAADNGHVGCAVMDASGSASGIAESPSDHLLLSVLPSTSKASYLAGF